VKYACIDAQGTDYPIQLMCRVLQVSRSGFFAWRARKTHWCPDADARVRFDLREAHQQSRRLYGRRRLTHALRQRGHCINAKRVHRLMRQEGLRGVRKGRFVPRTTDSQHDRAIASNVLARRFGVDAAVSGWVSDITYVPTREGWLYLAVIIALNTRRVVGYSLADRMPDDLVLNALRNACYTQPPPESTVFHSDRGSQYASDDFRAAIDALAMVPSMSRKGNCWDNAVAESFFATLKAEEITEPYDSKQDAHRRMAAYIHGFYNPVRLHSSLGYLSPNEYARRMKMSEKPAFMRSAE
jgi:putative transposase